MKKILSFVLMLCMVITMFIVIMPTTEVTAADAITDASVFLKQEKNNTCTLSSAAMLLRRRAYLEGNSNWASITESAIRSTAWAPGLYNSFKYAGISVSSGKFSGSVSDRKSKLISLLSAHPEGIVIYMYGDGLKTHAVLATDYDSATGIIYCADPANNIASGRIPLTSAYLTGNTQDARIGNLKKYWYVSSGNCNLTAPVPTPVVHTHSYTTQYESAHPHRYYRTCSCGASEYTGDRYTMSSCKQCKPLGSVSFKRSFEKTKGNATFYRNNVTNANSYTIELYQEGILYGSYEMNSTEKTITGLGSATYTAKLVVKNTSTGETKSVSCNSFKIVNTYKVSYNANGGSGAPSSQTKIQDEGLTLTSSIPTKKGYVFKGWASSKNATAAQYLAGGVYLKNAAITLYAVWEPEIYTIVFNANGGKGELENVTITYGDTMRMPNSVVRDDYYLKGWAKSSTATAADYKLGMDYTFDANTTLYAVWGKSTWSGDVSSSLNGSGTKGDPYQIATAGDLAYLANKVNTKSSLGSYEYYILTDNINLGYDKEWVPIGVYGNEYQTFYGSFDGNGFTVSDLHIEELNEGFVGLFGHITDSEIKNLTVTGSIENIETTRVVNIGGIVAVGSNSDIIDCSAIYTNISNITAGINAATGAPSYIGCIAGNIDNGNITECDAKDCYINLKAGRHYAGIVAGRVYGNIENCRVNSSTDELFGTSSEIGQFCIGGLCGYVNGNATKCTVDAAYLSATLKSSSISSIGGLTGGLNGKVYLCTVKFSEGLSKTVDSAMYNVSISAEGTGAVRIGGIAGYVYAGSKITDCKYDGQSLSGTSTADGAVSAGGIAGYTNTKSNSSVDVTGGRTLSRADLPTKTGYFATWYTDSDLTTPYNFTQLVTKDITLYAKWEEGSDKSDIWNGSSKEPAYNASTKTYTITSGEELAWISDVSNGVITSGTNYPSSRTFSGYTIKLAKHIRLNGSTKTNQWKPISKSSSYPFAGTFDGQGYTIYGIYINSSEREVAFFSHLDGGIIKNLFIEDSSIAGGVNTAGIVGYVESGTVSKCTVDATVSSTGSVGGIVGYNRGGTISYCVKKGTTKSTGTSGFVGGIVSYNLSTIKYCSNEGYIESYGISTGGICGMTTAMTKASTIYYCSNTGSINSYNGSTGGIVGSVSAVNGYYPDVFYCFNLANIDLFTIGIDDMSVGGIAGRSAGDIWYCYNKGEITGPDSIGGICPLVFEGTVKYVYNAGSYRDISSTLDTYGEGSLFAIVTRASIYACYSTNSTLYTKISSDVTSNYVSYKSASAMKTLTNLPWFSTNVWACDSSINGGYPYLLSLEDTYKTYNILAVKDYNPNEAPIIDRSFANVDGIIYGNGKAGANIGGIIGIGGATSTSSDETASNLLVYANRISAVSSGASYEANSGDIIGKNSEEKYNFDNTYSFSSVDLSATNSASGTTYTTSQISAPKTLTQITRASFLNTVFGPDAYQSMDYLDENSNAVWVIKDGELPELYYNCLNNITISSDIENGDVTVDKAQAIDGEVVTITATPDDGYVINKIYVNGTENVGSTFVVDGNSDIYVTFTEKVAEYEVSVDNNLNITATLTNVDSESAVPAANDYYTLSSDDTDSMSANDGEEIKINTSAIDGYAVEAIYVNGEEIAGDSFILTENTVVTMDAANISTAVNAVTNDAEDVGIYYATLSGTVEDAEGATRYMQYWKTDAPEILYTTEAQAGGGEYSVDIDGLEASTEYSFRMSESGEVKSFTTLADENTEAESDDPDDSGDTSVQVTGVKLNKTSTTLTVGATETLTATVLPSDATNKNVTWSSSDTSVATVSNGVVTAKAPGTAIITVTTAQWAYTADCTVTVEAAAVDADAVFTLSDVSGKPGDTVKVKLSLKSAEAINTIAVSGISYSSDLTFVGFSDYDEISSLAAITPTFDETNKAIVVGLRTAAAFDGDICTLNFKISDDAQEGDLFVSANSVVKLNSTTISSTVESSKVTVRTQLLGDINCDNAVDLQDAIMLLNHSMLPEIYTIPYVGSVDFYKDGSVDLRDAILLLNYSMLPEIYPIG